MGLHPSRGQRVAAFVAAAGISGVSLSGSQLFRPFSDRMRAQALLEGNWQSCRESDGQYAERVYDGRWPGLAPFELHMGPYHEFGLFRGIQSEHRDHDSRENLLKPYTVELVGNTAKHVGDVDGLRLEVVLTGGSREDCESWFVTLMRSGSSWH